MGLDMEVGQSCLIVHMVGSRMEVRKGVLDSRMVGLGRKRVVLGNLILAEGILSLVEDIRSLTGGILKAEVLDRKKKVVAVAARKSFEQIDRADSAVDNLLPEDNLLDDYTQPQSPAEAAPPQH